MPGRDVATKMGKLAKPVVEDGEKITEGVRQVTWSGGPLPDGRFLQFGVSVAMSGKAGDTAEFKTLQDGEGGAQTAWIQKTVEGQEEPEHPAPAVTLTAADESQGHGAGSDDAASSGEQARSDTGDDSSNTLAIIALIISALGLGTGGFALLRARKA